MPAFAYGWAMDAPAPVVPSPNSHAQDAMVPSGSLDARPSRFATRSAVVDAMTAVGSRLTGGATTVTCVDAVPVRPLSSVTVSATV